MDITNINEDIIITKKIRCTLTNDFNYQSLDNNNASMMSISITLI